MDSERALSAGAFAAVGLVIAGLVVFVIFDHDFDRAQAAFALVAVPASLAGSGWLLGRRVVRAARRGATGRVAGLGASVVALAWLMGAGGVAVASALVGEPPGRIVYGAVVVLLSPLALGPLLVVPLGVGAATALGYGRWAVAQAG